MKPPVALLLLLFCLVSCSRDIRTPEYQVKLGNAPVRPAEFPQVEREVVASIIATGTQAAAGIPKTVEMAGINTTLWEILADWVGMGVPFPLTERAVTRAKQELQKQVKSRGEAFEKYEVEDAKYKAYLAELEAKTILVAKDKRDVNDELLALRKENEKLEKQVTALESKGSSLLFWGLQVFGALGVGASIFLGFRFGKYFLYLGLLGTVALYIGGTAAYIWAYHRTLVILALSVAGGVIVLAIFLYSYWGAFVEKIWKKQVTVHQQVREALEPAVREVVDSKFREKGDELLKVVVDRTKKSLGLKSVQ